MTVRAANNPFEGTTLDVAAKRSCAPQWRAFMEALSTTLSEVAGDELALRILGGVGAAIAKQQPVAACSSLADLKTALNTALGVLDWGQVDIKEADKALEFVVIGYPYFEGIDAQAAFAATLEAVLDGWLTMQATKPGLTMRLVDRGRGAYPPLVFRYERINAPSP
jgi:Cellulose synthase subunit D